MAEKKRYVYVITTCIGYDSVGIERRVLLSEAEESCVLARKFYPNGETVPRGRVHFTWDEAVAAYWVKQRGILAALHKRVKAVEKHIRVGKEPRFRKVGG